MIGPCRVDWRGRQLSTQAHPQRNSYATEEETGQAMGFTGETI